MIKTSPFADVPPDKQGDMRFLLERVFYALVEEIDKNNTVVKGKVGELQGKVKNLEGAVLKLEACPCPKRHDAKASCPLWLLEKEVLKNKWRNAGIYTGVFLSGAVAYYLVQVALAWMKVG
ncbi:MAG: hypothetical protein M1438_19930 [Deltaproteobacteria bacterium]|nr:hypothetical protein [Deltaproteobacteria bacterium]